MKIATAAAALILASSLMLAPQPASAQVADLDLERFSGRWYEIARNPNRFQRDCTRLSVDFTARDPGRYRVVHTCTRRSDGEIETLNANARVTDSVVSGRLKTSSMWTAAAGMRPYVPHVFRPSRGGSAGRADHLRRVEAQGASA